MFADVMEAVTGRPLPRTPARLDGFARRALRRRPYPAAVAWPGEAIEGALYDGVDDALLARLDRFEGALYARCEVEVALAGGARRDAWVYLLAPAQRGELLAAPWDPARFAREDLDAFRRAAEAFRAGDETRAGARSFVR